jgi:hypothetical protein
VHTVTASASRVMSLSTFSNCWSSSSLARPSNSSSSVLTIVTCGAHRRQGPASVWVLVHRTSVPNVTIEKDSMPTRSRALMITTAASR